MPLKILFIPYGLVLASMTGSAILRGNKTTSSSYWAALIGSILFAASDNTLASCKFHHYKSVWCQFTVMFTYYLGQWFITQAALNHDKPTKTKP